MIKYSVWESMRRPLFTETLYSEKRETRGFNARKAAGREGVLAEEVLGQRLVECLNQRGKQRENRGVKVWFPCQRVDDKVVWFALIHPQPSWSKTPTYFTNKSNHPVKSCLGMLDGVKVESRLHRREYSVTVRRETCKRLASWVGWSAAILVQ